MSEVAVAEQTASFDGFVASRGSALWRSAWLLTGDNQLAEDLVRAALAKSWPAWDRVTAGKRRLTKANCAPLFGGAPISLWSGHVRVVEVCGPLGR